MSSYFRDVYNRPFRVKPSCTKAANSYPSGEDLRSAWSGSKILQKKTNMILKTLVRGFGVNDNANFRKFWEILYIHFSEIAISKNEYNFFNPCRDEPPENKRKLSPTRLESHRKYYRSSKGKKNLLKSVKAYDQRNKKK